MYLSQPVLQFSLLYQGILKNIMLGIQLPAHIPGRLFIPQKQIQQAAEQRQRHDKDDPAYFIGRIIIFSDNVEYNGDTQCCERRGDPAGVSRQLFQHKNKPNYLKQYKNNRNNYPVDHKSFVLPLHQLSIFLSASHAALQMRPLPGEPFFEPPGGVSRIFSCGLSGLLPLRPATSFLISL